MTEELTPSQKALVEKNLDLAHFLARDAWNRNREELDIEEVVSIAYQGLIKAAQRFDPNRMSPETVANGKAFAGFARQKISGAILDWQREVDHVQRSYRQIYKQAKQLGYSKPHRYKAQKMDYYADQLNIPREKLDEVVRSVEETVLSLQMDVPSHGPGATSEAGEWTDGTWVEDRKNTVEGSVMETQITSAVQRAYMDLPVLQQVIIAMRWYGHEEFQVIAVELGISLNAVREAHSDALMTIHHAMVRTVSDRH